MSKRSRKALKIGAWVAGLSAMALAIALPSCGGGGGGPSGPSGPPVTTAPSTPTTTTPPAGSGPTIKVSVDKVKGKEPLKVSFDLSGSTGTNLSYWADFEGDGLQQTSGAHFTHTYSTDGVTIRHTRLEVHDDAGRTDDKTVDIKVWVDSKVEVKKNTGCQGTIDATAILNINGLGVRAAGEVDKVVFKAFTASGNTPLGQRPGDRVNPKQWKSGVWNVNNTTKLRVIAIVSSSGIESEDLPDDTRPEC